MQINTALNCGDKAWTFDGDCIRQRTVGQVQVIFTYSPGIGDGFMEGGVASYSGSSFNYGVPENYAPMEPELVEKYMCVETGIGIGSVYTLGEQIFISEEECRAAHAVRLAEIAEEKRQREEWEAERRAQRIRSLRAELDLLQSTAPEVV